MTIAARFAKLLRSFVNLLSRPVASYSGGNVSRLNAQQILSAGNANREIRWTLSTMRMRSRTLERDDPYAQRFLKMVEINVVGHNGVAMQSRAGDIGPGPDYKFVPDSAANSIIEREWAAFSRLGMFDITGKLSRAMFERLLIRTIARDGEVLVKIVADQKARHGIKFQMLEADWLDERLNEDLPNGNRIVMGVEMDPAGKPVAYWLHENHPGDTKRGTGKRIRYTVDQIRHYFIAERPEQVRGVPWMHAALNRLYQLGEFDDAAILAARLGADKFMVLEDENGEAASMADGSLSVSDSSAPSVDEGSGALYFQSQKGSIDILPRGTKLADFNPNYPSDQYGPFTLAALRGVSSGLNVSYESLSNDREGVTWTSIRHGVLDDREMWKGVQEWFIETWSWDGFTVWLDSSLLSPFKPLNYLPAGKRDKFLAPSFQGRRWDWVNPKDDIEAKEKALQLRITSHRRVLAEQGLDIEEVLAEIDEDRALAAKYGIDLDAVFALKQPTQQPSPPPAEPPPTARRTSTRKKPKE